MHKFTHYKRAREYDFAKWLKTELELTPYQLESLNNHIMDKKTPFYPYEVFVKKDKTVSKLWRLTLLLYPIVFIVLVLGLPLNYFISGRWGYKRTEWLEKWEKILNINI